MDGPNPAKLRALFEKDKAVLSQKVDHMEIQLQEAKKRESQLKASYLKMVEMIQGTRDLPPKAPNIFMTNGGHNSILNSSDYRTETKLHRNWTSNPSHNQFSFQDPLVLVPDPGRINQNSKDSSRRLSPRELQNTTLMSNSGTSSRSILKQPYQLKQSYLTKNQESQKSQLKKKLQDTYQGNDLSNDLSTMGTSTNRHLTIMKEIENCQNLNKRIAERIETIHQDKENGFESIKKTKHRSNNSSNLLNQAPSFKDIEIEASDFTKQGDTGSKVKGSSKKKLNKNNFFAEQISVTTPKNERNSSIKKSPSKSKRKSLNLSVNSIKAGYGYHNCHYACHFSGHQSVKANGPLSSKSFGKKSNSSYSKKEMKEDQSSSKLSTSILKETESKQSTIHLKERILNNMVLKEHLNLQNSSSFNDQKKVIQRQFGDNKKPQIKLEKENYHLEEQLECPTQRNGSNKSLGTQKRMNLMASQGSNCNNSSSRTRGIMNDSKRSIKDQKSSILETSILNQSERERKKTENFDNIEMTKELIHKLMKDKIVKKSTTAKDTTKLLSNIFSTADQDYHIPKKYSTNSVNRTEHTNSVTSNSKADYRSCNNSFQQNISAANDVTLDNACFKQNSFGNKSVLSGSTKLNHSYSQAAHKLDSKFVKPNIPKPIDVYKKMSKSPSKAKSFAEQPASISNKGDSNSQSRNDSFCSRAEPQVTSSNIKFNGSVNSQTSESRMPTININLNAKETDYNVIRIDSNPNNSVNIVIERQEKPANNSLNTSKLSQEPRWPAFSSNNAFVSMLQPKTPVSSGRPLLNLRPQTTKCSVLRTRNPLLTKGRDSSREEQKELNFEESKSEYEQVQNTLNKEWSRLQTKYLCNESQK